ncbi:MAG TPA: hypothetical protein ENG51_09355 [Deltaproteobacteria bacterium]|nr:hypothetical protein [Deltaproteobacteria bacterium]
MGCRKWQIAAENDVVTLVVSTVDFRERWCIKHEDLVISYILSIDRCPFCYSKLDEEGCTGHDTD